MPGANRNWARSNWTGRNSDGKWKERQVLYSSFWLCAFAILAYWILGFCFRGLFFLFSSNFFGLPACRWVQRTGLSRTGLDLTGLFRGLMKERRDWKLISLTGGKQNVTLCLYTRLMDRVYKDDSLHTFVMFLFSPQQKATGCQNQPLVLWVWLGRTGQ